MGICRFILTKISCKSSCVYNIDNEMYDRNAFTKPLAHYQLKIKDMKKIMKILNKREYIHYPVRSETTDL